MAEIKRGPIDAELRRILRDFCEGLAAGVGIDDDEQRRRLEYLLLRAPRRGVAVDDAWARIVDLARERGLEIKR